MPIYQNQRERPEVRMTAVWQVLKTLPEQQIVDQIAKTISRERSTHVASYVFSYLNGLANTTNPCEKKL